LEPVCLREAKLIAGRRNLAVVARWAVGLVACSAGTLLADEWVDWRTAEPFVCRADFRLAGAEPLLVELQQLKTDLSAALELRPSNEPIELYLFQTKSRYQVYLRRRHPDVPQRKAIFIKDRGPGQVYAYKSSEFEVDLRHETTHALLHAGLAVVPLWLDEGLAEYFEVPSTKRAYDHPHLASAKWNVRWGLAPKLSTLETMREVSQMGRKEYVHSWAWVHFLLHGPPEAKRELLRYVSDLRTGVPNQALSVRLARQLPAVQQRFNAHFQGWSR
jgi:hypothetical protein